MYRKALATLVIVVAFFILDTKGALATQTLQNVSDTISTSRPSASAPLNADAAANATQVTVVDNGSIYIASDSAQMKVDPVSTDAQTDASLNVASMSAQIAGSPNTRIIYLTNINGIPHGTHHKGDAFLVPITAMHTIQFKTTQAVPTLGKITVAFPALSTGDAAQPASASASTFELNGITSSQVAINGLSGAGTFTVATTNASNGIQPSIAISLTGTTNIPAGTTVTVLLGCSSQSSGTCTTQVPLIINPTKTKAAGTADNWKINVTTTDVTNSTDLDTGRAVIGTIESVQVQAQIDPTLTFTIAGINTGTALNSGHGASCPSESTNSGINSAATFVNLGTVGTGITLAAQDLTVSTNGTGGYSLTATSSGTLINPASGYSIVSSTTPGTMTAATELFGIHPCGTDANSTFVPGSAVTGGGGGKVAWPTPTSALSLASRTGTSNSVITTIEYAITASNITPEGVYTSVITYVATPTFN